MILRKECQEVMADGRVQQYTLHLHMTQLKRVPEHVVRVTQINNRDEEDEHPADVDEQ